MSSFNFVKLLGLNRWYNTLLLTAFNTLFWLNIQILTRKFREPNFYIFTENFEIEDYIFGNLPIFKPLSYKNKTYYDKIIPNIL